MKSNRFTNGDKVMVFKTPTQKAGSDTAKGIIVGVYDGFLRVRLDGARVPISVQSTSCYLIAQ